jgi:hypothetical protein
MRIASRRINFSIAADGTSHFSIRMIFGGPQSLGKDDKVAIRAEHCGKLHLPGPFKNERIRRTSEFVKSGKRSARRRINLGDRF